MVGKSLPRVGCRGAVASVCNVTCAVTVVALRQGQRRYAIEQKIMSVPILLRGGEQVKVKEKNKQ